jgi:hypothetical protein
MTTIIINEELGSNLVTIYGLPTKKTFKVFLRRNYLRKIIFILYVLEGIYYLSYIVVTSIVLSLRFQHFEYFQSIYNFLFNIKEFLVHCTKIIMLLFLVRA